ncbi:MAG TPA: type II and III secretion system protein family protein [Roseiarcus sp.]|nr:type II and III secretion system protein family protein [Roseiarcus sp.]
MRSDRIQRRPSIVICIAAALLTIAPASGAHAAADSLRVSGASDPAAQHLQLGVGQSVIFDLPEEAGEIYVGDPGIANAIVRSARRVYISGVANGQTSIFALARDGRRIAVVQVTVGRNVAELSNLLNTAIPGNEIHVRTVENTIILTGSVGSAEEAQKALDIADGFVNDTAPSTQGATVSISNGSSGAASAGGGASGGSSGKSNSPRGRIINALTIRGADQVSLRVTVAEIRREIVKQLGVNLSGSGPNGSFTLDNPFAINGAVATSEGTLNWVKGNQSLSANLQAFERQGVAHTLAEPTVTAVSGETAKFLAGGTIPILNSVTCQPTCQYGFIQQPYGVTLNFTPVVLSPGRIQLRIATEVTDIDYSTQITYSGISIPGFRTRNNTTTVELPSGGSIASAGLISTQTQQAINGFPALMNVPILGALFRSRDYQRNETELLIVVTPYIAHAVDPSQVVRPDQNFQDASDPQTWFLGRVNRIYSTSPSLEPMPGYAGKIGFITQ